MNPQVEEAIKQQQVIDDMRVEAKSPEDHAYLDAKKAKLDQERLQAVNERLGQFTVQDGVVVPRTEVEAERAAGHEVGDGPYKNNQR